MSRQSLRIAQKVTLSLTDWVTGWVTNRPVWRHKNRATYWPLWDIEDRRRWGHDVEDSDIEDRRRWGQTTLRTGNAEDRRHWGQATLRTNSFPNTFPNFIHIFSNVGSKYPIKYVHSTNRNPQNYIFSPNVGRWQHISNETFIPQVLASYIQYILKCWQHISNKICSFPKCWHHISNIF